MGDTSHFFVLPSEKQVKPVAFILPIYRTMGNENKIIGLIRKYLENRCDGEDLDELILLLHDEDFQPQIESLLYGYWQKTPSFRNKLEKSELDEMLNSIHHQINLSGSGQRQKGLVRKLSGYLARAAAVLFLPLLLGTIWVMWQNAPYRDADLMVTLETPLGSKLKTTLPDGTEVWQNAGTTLKYPAQFTRKNREVELIGEAYFHVSTDKKNPFFVKTSGGTVKVTGTRFNVTTFAEDDFTAVVLEEGEVSYLPLNGNKEVLLNPSQRLVYRKNSNSLARQEADVEKYISWTEGRLIFRNDPLSEVVFRLQRWYNADIILNDPSGKLGQHPFTMTIQNETLPQVLNYIAQAANLELKKKDYGLIKDKTLVKPYYIISKKN